MSLVGICLLKIIQPRFKHTVMKVGHCMICEDRCLCLSACSYLAHIDSSDSDWSEYLMIMVVIVICMPYKVFSCHSAIFVLIYLLVLVLVLAFQLFFSFSFVLVFVIFYVLVLVFTRT